MRARSTVPPSRRRGLRVRSAASRVRTAAFLFGAATIGFGLAGCQSAGSAEDEAEGSPEVPINVRTLEITPRDLDEYVSVTGPLRPASGTDLSTEESGTVDAIARDKGARVRAGEAVVVLHRALLETEKRASAANLELLEYDESRMRQLFAKNQISRYEMLGKETELARARATADAARIRWERAAVKAPFDGLVTDRYVEPGQLVAPGSRVARIVDPYTLKLRASVSERRVPWIREGAPASVTLVGVEEVVPGRVSWVGFEADPATGKFVVEVSVDNRDLTMRPGIVARAEILIRTHRGEIVIPRDAVVPQPAGDAVFVADGNRARMRMITLGPDQGALTTVAAGSLEFGDQLLVRGQRDVLEGSLVRVTEEATAADGTRSGDPAEIREAQAFAPVLPATTDEIPPAPRAGAAGDAGKTAR